MLCTRDAFWKTDKLLPLDAAAAGAATWFETGGNDGGTPTTGARLEDTLAIVAPMPVPGSVWLLAIEIVVLTFDDFDNAEVEAEDLEFEGYCSNASDSIPTLMLGVTSPVDTREAVTAADGTMTPGTDGD